MLAAARHLPRMRRDMLSFLLCHRITFGGSAQCFGGRGFWENGDAVLFSRGSGKIPDFVVSFRVVNERRSGREGTGRTMKKQSAGEKKPEKRDWLAEILLNATSERRRINSIKLPDEPDFQDRPSRVDDGQFQSSVGNLMSEVGDKIERAEKEKQAEIKAKGVEPVDETAAIRGSNSVHTWSS